MNFDRLDEFLVSLEERHETCTDLALYLDGKLIHRHMHGLSDRENGIPVTEKTLFRFFSMTKPITCAAMLKLYEEGRFLLTDPVAEYLPEFAQMKVDRTAGKMAEQITIRQLFTMTSGLTYNLETDALKKLYAEKPDFTTRDFVKAVAASPLAFRPGEHWYYSLAHDVLAAVVEVISGKRFSEYLKETFFDPLGMTDTYFWLPQDQVWRSCVRYRTDSAPGVFVRDEGETDTQRYNRYQISPNFESGGAGLTTTVDEYAKFAVMLTQLGMGMNGVRVLNARTVDMMRQNQLTPQQLEDFACDKYSGYGYGLGVRTLMDRAAAGALGPAGEFGWSGAAGTHLLCDPETGLTLVYAQQSDPNDEPYIHRRLRNLVYAALD